MEDGRTKIGNGIRQEEYIYIQHIMNHLERQKKDLTIYFQVFQSFYFTFALGNTRYSVADEHE